MPSLSNEPVAKALSALPAPLKALVIFSCVSILALLFLMKRAVRSIERSPSPSLLDQQFRPSRKQVTLRIVASSTVMGLPFVRSAFSSLFILPPLLLWGALGLCSVSTTRETVIKFLLNQTWPYYVCLWNSAFLTFIQTALKISVARSQMAELQITEPAHQRSDKSKNVKNMMKVVCLVLVVCGIGSLFVSIVWAFNSASFGANQLVRALQFIGLLMVANYATTFVLLTIIVVVLPNSFLISHNQMILLCFFSAKLKYKPSLRQESHENLAEPTNQPHHILSDFNQSIAFEHTHIRQQQQNSLPNKNMYRTPRALNVDNQQQNLQGGSEMKPWTIQSCSRQERSQIPCPNKAGKIILVKADRSQQQLAGRKLNKVRKGSHQTSVTLTRNDSDRMDQRGLDMVDLSNYKLVDLGVAITPQTSFKQSFRKASLATSSAQVEKENSINETLNQKCQFPQRMKRAYMRQRNIKQSAPTCPLEEGSNKKFCILELGPQASGPEVAQQ